MACFRQGPSNSSSGRGEKVREIGSKIINYFTAESEIPRIEGTDRYTYRNFELRRRYRTSLYFKRLRIIYFIYCLVFFLAAYPYLLYSWKTVVVLAAITTAYALFRRFPGSSREGEGERSFYLDLFDYILIGIVVYLTGGVYSFFIGAFVLPILATTLRFNINLGLCGFGTAAVLITIGALLPGPLPGSGHYPPLFYLLFALGTMFIAINSIAKLSRDELNLSAMIYHYSVTDPLTGLFHSGYICERIREEIAFSDRTGSPFSIIFIDLNRFKEVNDQYGHLAGDKMLREIAGRLRGTARRGETIARYAGDEFLLLLPGTMIGEARVTLKRLLRQIESQPYYLADGSPLWISASGGTAEYPHDGATLEKLLQTADQNMYRTKQLNCRNPF